jgi:hypothetical protein
MRKPVLDRAVCNVTRNQLNAIDPGPHAVVDNPTPATMCFVRSILESHTEICLEGPTCHEQTARPVTRIVKRSEHGSKRAISLDLLSWASLGIWLAVSVYALALCP